MSVSGGNRAVPLSLSGNVRKSHDKLARSFSLPFSLYQAETAVLFCFSLTGWVFRQLPTFLEIHYFHLKIYTSFLGSKL